MIVMNGIHTCCVDVVEISGICSFIQEASEIMTGFCSMAAGQKMRFPTVEIADKIIEEYKKEIKPETEKGLIVVKIEEMLMNNYFELWVNVLNPPCTISIQDTKYMADCKKLMAFSAVPESGY
jgi:hypothetical protein